MTTAIHADQPSVKFALSNAYVKRSRWYVSAALIVGFAMLPILMAVGINPFGFALPVQVAVAPLIIACLMLPRLLRKLEQQLREISPPLQSDDVGILADSDEPAYLLKWDGIWRVRIWRNSIGETRLLQFDRTEGPAISLMNYDRMNELEQLVREFLGADVIVDDRQPSAIQGNRWIRAAVAVLTLLALLALASALVQIGGWKLLRVMGGVVSVVFGIVLIFFAPTSRLNPKRRRAEILGGFTMVVTSLGALLIDILG